MTKFEQAKQAHGSVTFRGVEYAMTQDAYVENFGTDGDVMYYAAAIDIDGNDFRVQWERTPEWKASEAVAQAEMRGEEPDMGAICEEHGLDADDFTPYALDDESYACDWDAPDDVIAR